MNQKEFDSSSIAWETYKLMYAANFENGFDEIKDDKPRKYISHSFKYHDKYTEQMNFSGETDFNFGNGWSHTTYDKYKKYISQSLLPDEFSLYDKQLQICQEKLYKSIVNISIMPQTGNLQAVKKGIGNDRIDSFIWALNEYYYQNSNILMNYSSYENRSVLKSYLDNFGNVYNYCNAIYHIDKSLVNDLIISGKTAIDSADRTISYMKLAAKFWKQKIIFLENQSNRTKEIDKELCRINNILDVFCLENSSYPATLVKM